MTVAELRAALAGYPDDHEVIVSSHCEIGGGIDHVGPALDGDGNPKRVVVASWNDSCLAFG